MIAPAGVIRPMALVVPASVNHRFPSGPAAMPSGMLPGFRPLENSVIAPAGVMRPMALVVPWSANHRFPSGPAAIWFRRLPGSGRSRTR